MGNLCSTGRNKSSDPSSPDNDEGWGARPAQPKNKPTHSDPFKGSGRTLSSATPSKGPGAAGAGIPSRARPVPEAEADEGQGTGTGEEMGNEQSSPKKKAGGAVKSTTGGGGRALGAGPVAEGERSANDARSLAAKAAEARMANAQAPSGKLGKQLQAQKRSTGVAGGALQEASRETRGQRGADEAREAREYN